MHIEIQTIPHLSQRYPTVGDWKISRDGSISICVSEMGIEDYNLLVGLHELVEVWLCHKRGIAQSLVDDFDIWFEKNRPEGDVSEPGDHPQSPYFREHRFATKIERQVAEELGVNWEQYSTTVESL